MQIPLGFDASTSFHTYKFVWTQSSIEWYVDNGTIPIRAVSGSVPSLPGKIMVNLWAADNSTVGMTFGSLIYSGPIHAHYDWIQYSP
jgi:beta-glucanase (GH16 family)